ncbi:MAG TPA: acyl-CoA dehydrogenase [Peptococcaceae bacterium]|nr:acyl-CoA dehydrogenase [Peptococcaceae bacterium]
MRYPLSEEHLLIQQTAREFAERYVKPEASAVDRAGAHPQELVRRMAEHDFLGLPFPQECGGAEAGFLSFVLAIEQIARASASVAAIPVNHFIASYTLYRWGSAEVKEQLLPVLCRGEKLGAFAFYEPGAAPGSGDRRLVATRTPAGYVLNGTKYFVPNGGVADLYVVVAQTDPERGQAGFSAFVLDGNTPGMRIARRVETMGLNGCQVAEIVFEGVEVSAGRLVGPENGAASMIREMLAMRRIAGGAMVAGIMDAALEESVKYAGQRVQFGRPIGRFPAIRKMIADMAANLNLLRLAVYSTADLVDKGEPFEAEAAMVHMFAGRTGQAACIDAIQIHGGYGYSQELPVERFFRDVKGALVYDSIMEQPEQVVAGGLMG